jgi:hypothetical protein
MTCGNPTNKCVAAKVTLLAQRLGPNVNIC